MSIPNNHELPHGLSRDSLQIIYDQGSDAVFGLVSKLYSVTVDQALTIGSLATRVQELETRLNKDSNNSSKPPSSDGLHKKPHPKSQRQAGTKKSGGQPGHPGSTLRMSDSPKKTSNHMPPPNCTGCGGALRDPSPLDYDRRQIFDLPPMVLEVTEHRCFHQTCPECGQVNRGAFPENVTQPVQYGENIKALGVYFSTAQLLPWKRTTQILHDLFGCSLSEAVIQSVQQKSAQSLSPITQSIKQALLTKDVLHFDETGQRIEGKLHWLHVTCTRDLTYYITHLKRGWTAMNDIGILPNYIGIAVHDAWASYSRFNCEHRSCNSHHLRELTGIAEDYGQIWAQRMKTFLLEVQASVEQAVKSGQTCLTAAQIADFEGRYRQILQQGHLANPKTNTSGKRGRVRQTPGRNLLLRLENRNAVLGFMDEFRVPFTNNQAEQDIRMMKVRQKVSGCFRTLEGAEDFGTIRGYLSTMKKQGHNMLDVLTSVVQGQPRAPVY